MADPRFITPSLEDPVFFKIVGLGYGVLALACLRHPVQMLFKPSSWTTIFPNLCLLAGLLAPFFLMPQLAIPGTEKVSPFDPAAITGKPLNGDWLCLLRLMRWYNYQAIANPIGGPIVNGFAVLGMLFAGKGGNFKYFCLLSILGCTYLHLKWVYQHPVQDLVIDKMAPATFLQNLWQDTMVVQSKTPGFPPVHDGKTGYMPASYTTDYLGMIGVAVIYSLLEEDSILGKLKALLLTVVCGGASGLIYAARGSLLGTAPKPASLFKCVLYLAWAAFCVYDWLPFQMNWIDFAITPDGRLGGGLINDNVKYCTLSVVAPYFALCAICIAHYHRQNLPTLHKGVLFFNAAAFLFFHIAAASAIMMGMSCFWGALGDAEAAETKKKEDKKRK